MCEIILKLLETCAPIIIGALIVLIPNTIDKLTDRKISKEEKELQYKREVYVELISLFAKIIPHDRKKEDVDLLRDQINLVFIIGNNDVIRILNEYIGTWGKETGKIQNEKYRELIKAIRVDLQVDKKLNNDLPDIGLIDLNVLKNNVTN